VASQEEARTEIALSALAGGVTILGFAALFVKWAHAPGTVTALYRMLFGSALVTPIIVARSWRRDRALVPRLDRRGVLLAGLGGAIFGCDMAIWMTAVGIGGTTLPTLMANTAPLWVGLGSLIIFHERLRAGFWGGLALALAGVGLTVGRDLGGATASSLGMMLGLLASFFYAGFQLVTQEGRKRLDTLSYLWISTLGAAAAMLVLNLALRRDLTGFDSRTWLSFLALGAVVQFLGWLFINYAQGHMRASTVAPTLLGQPVITAILAAILLDEVLTPWHIAGSLAVLAGVYVVIRSRRRQPKPETI
jgi:drug/metabolite transporter (DMT)-like permease